MGKRPKITPPAIPPPTPMLADEVIQSAGASAAATATSGGRAGSFLTAGTGGASAPGTIASVKSSAPTLPWDFGAPGMIASAARRALPQTRRG